MDFKEPISPKKKEIDAIVSEETGRYRNNNGSEMLAQAFALQYYGEGSHPHADSLIEYIKTLVR